ncbi:MAG: nucleotidyltransferase family protein [Crocinitomicaceae bacterium]|nr:nucleotidyltransferase family protein [Crocinitomicaceae bacterium]
MSELNSLREHLFVINALSNKSSDNQALLDMIDPTTLIRVIQQHKIVSGVGKVSINLPDSEINHQIDQAYQENKIYQLTLTNELYKIYDWFEEIQFITLKGPVLSQFLHNDPAERSSTDLDILVGLDNLDQCTEILIAKGYKLLTEFNSPKQKEAILKYYHHFEFYNADKGILIELHWGLLARDRQHKRIHDLIEQTSIVEISGRKFKILNLSPLVEYLSTHGTFHLFFRLQWLYDIKIIFLKLSEEKLLAVLTHCEKNKTEKQFLTALNLIHQLFGTELPQSVLDKIETTSDVKTLTKMSIRSINDTSNGITSKRTRNLMSKHRVQLITNGFSGIMKSIWSRNVRPENWKIYAFPDSVFFLNNLFSRIIWMYGKMTGKLK